MQIFDLHYTRIKLAYIAVFGNILYVSGSKTGN
jgi:hypothetical protein